jgi:hypothetical protein
MVAQSANELSYPIVRTFSMLVYYNADFCYTFNHPRAPNTLQTLPFVRLPLVLIAGENQNPPSVPTSIPGEEVSSVDAEDDAIDSSDGRVTKEISPPLDSRAGQLICFGLCMYWKKGE